MPDLYRFRPAAIATYPMYKGLARIVGMEVLPAGKTVEGLFQALGTNWVSFDFFYVHVKYADSRGEDGDFDAKRRSSKKSTAYCRVLELEPDVLVVTGDHSTLASCIYQNFSPFSCSASEARRVALLRERVAPGKRVMPA